MIQKFRKKPVEIEANGFADNRSSDKRLRLSLLKGLTAIASYPMLSEVP
jgi:hypothetical protein